MSSESCGRPVLVLPKLPWPPSENNLYPTIGGVRRSSTELKIYRREINNWSLVNHRLVHEARKMARGAYGLEIHRFYFCHWDRFFTKNGTVRKWDVSNLNKATDDAVSQILGVDDRFFFIGSEHKIPNVRPAQHEHCQVEIRAVSRDRLMLGMTDPAIGMEGLE